MHLHIGHLVTFIEIAVWVLCFGLFCAWLAGASWRFAVAGLILFGVFLALMMYVQPFGG